MSKSRAKSSRAKQPKPARKPKDGELGEEALDHVSGGAGVEGLATQAAMTSQQENVEAASATEKFAYDLKKSLISKFPGGRF